MGTTKKSVVLAGGFDQIALIKELKKRGYFIILIDYYMNPPAKEHADVHYQVSTLDVEKIKKIAIEENVDLITTACTDQALLSVAKISEELKLPCYISYEKALNVTNKMYMKNLMNEYEIPTAKHKVLSSINDVNFEDLNFPIVVKPCDCNSSKGVKKIYSGEDGIKSINEALSISSIKAAIVEEFIEGNEISVDAFVTQGKANIMLITQSNKIKNSNGFTITQSKYPVVLSGQNIQKIKNIVQIICNSFGLENSPLLVQMLVSNNNLFVIEFSARMGGGTKYKLIEVLTGVNIMKSYVDLITGEVPIIKCENKLKYAHLNYCYTFNGIFKMLIGFEELKRQKIIIDYFKYKNEGSLIDKSETSSDRVAGYLIIGDTYEELIKKEEIANNTLRILSIQDKDIMRHDLVDY